jgi:fatty-acyl-CoA synthase
VPGRDRVRIVCAGAPPPTKTIERIETELGWEFIQIYGLTETTPLLTMNRGAPSTTSSTPAERATKLSRAGAPAIGVEVRISPDGEMLARGNHVWAATGRSPRPPPTPSMQRATRPTAPPGSTPATAASSTTTGT